MSIRTRKYRPLVPARLIAIYAIVLFVAFLWVAAAKQSAAPEDFVASDHVEKTV